MVAPSLSSLASRLPHGAVSMLEADRLAVSMDLWPRHILGLWSGKTPALPTAVVWPESTRDVQAIVAYAHATGTALVPYGAGSSVVGGASPTPGQLVVDLKRMARVLSIDDGARMARGCTSGQALSGGAVLSAGSWAFMMCVFAGAYAVAYFVRKFWN